MDGFFDFPLSREKLSEQVAEQIQGLIVAESLRPGDKLPGERELAERLGVSRTVLREALRALSVRGLVQVKAGCGTYVRELSVQDATAPMELFLKLRQTPGSYTNLSEVRRSLEVEIATLAAQRATDEDVRTLAESVARMEQEAGDAEGFARADLGFHLALAEATHNELFPILLGPIAGLLCETILLSYYGPRAAEAGLRHHTNILRAIAAHDGLRARRAMREHLRESEALVRAVQEELEAGG